MMVEMGLSNSENEPLKQCGYRRCRNHMAKDQLYGQCAFHEKVTQYTVANRDERLSSQQKWELALRRVAEEVKDGETSL